MWTAIRRHLPRAGLGLFFAALAVGHASSEENPLTDRVVLGGFLQQLGFEAPISYEQRVDRRDMKAEAPYLGYLIEKWLVDLAPVSDLDKWPYTISLLTDEVQMRARTLSVQLARRSLRDAPIRYNTWVDGHTSYASAFVEYGLTSAITGENSLRSYKATVIVKQSPVTGGWSLSNYQGERSQIDSSDDDAIMVVLKHEMAAATDAFEEREKYVKSQSIELIRKKHFANYESKGEILHLKLDGEPDALVHTRPGVLNSKEDSSTHMQRAADHCGALVVDGIDGWMVPRQHELAFILHGSSFKKWQRMTLKDLPTGYFFRALRDAIPKPRFDWFRTIITRGHDGDRVHVVKFANDLSVLWGSSESYDSFEGMAVVCINTDDDALLRFRQLNGG